MPTRCGCGGHRPVVPAPFVPLLKPHLLPGDLIHSILAAQSRGLVLLGATLSRTNGPATILRSPHKPSYHEGALCLGALPCTKLLPVLQNPTLQLLLP
jgi:hypothetical protein